MFLPKYTVKLQLEEKPMKLTETPSQQAMVFDMDYTNMKRLQDELQAAIKSVDNTYSKKVQKFIRWDQTKTDKRNISKNNCRCKTLNL